MRRIKILRQLLIISIVVCLGIYQTIYSSAYVTCGYKMTGSWQDENYYVVNRSVTYNGITIDFGSLADSAVTLWNTVDSSSGHNLDIALTETTNGSSVSTRVSIGALDRGNTGWAGFTYYIGYNTITHEHFNINYGGYPNQNYHAGSAVINLYYVQNYPGWKIKNVIMHEMGHAFGLKHSDVSGALMAANVVSYTYLKMPQNDDINGVRSIYE